MVKRKIVKFFHPGKSLNWFKEDGQQRRRDNALKARKGNALKAAQALQALANVTQDPETKRKARADALYFYNIHNKKKKSK